MHTNNESTAFFTGGHDKQICLWTCDSENNEYPDMVERLPYEHNTSVFAMAWRSLTDSLISASGQKVWTYNAKKGLLGKAVEISNKVCQVHVHPQNPQIAILEVRR
jgi:WD40 repeat protein